MTPPVLDVGAILPMIIVAAGAVLMPLFEVLLARMIQQKRTWLSRPMTRELAGTMMAFGTALILGTALIFTLGGFLRPDRVFNADHPLIRLDAMALFLNAVVLLSAIMTVLISIRYLAELRNNRGEYYALLLASVLGMMLLTSAMDLLMLFLALELMTIPIYALAGYQRSSLRSNESALKYFVIGSFASGLLLYGTALLYGATGTLALDLIGQARFDQENPVALVGAGLLVIGLVFKVGGVPFHQWAPDVYEGAPTSVTGFMATAVKVAAFGALIRVMAVALGPSQDQFYVPLWVIAVLSMTVGNVMALIQRSVKRMLAYSSIAHAGYAMVGICVGTDEAYAAVLFYLLVYTFMSLGAFAVLAMATRERTQSGEIGDLAGLHATRPFFAAVMAICMFALAGIPGTGGFMGKFKLFEATIARWSATPADQGLLWLAVIGVLNSAVSLYYYLRVPVAMYMEDPRAGETEQPGSGFFGWLVLATCAAAIFLLGLMPQDLGLFWNLDPLAGAAAAADALR